MTLSPSPYSQAVLDFWHGDADAVYTIHCDDGFTTMCPWRSLSTARRLTRRRATRIGSLYRQSSRYRSGCRGGMHSFFRSAAIKSPSRLNLSENWLASCQSAALQSLWQRASLFPRGGPFDTLLMLMNGLGLVGTPSGAEALFEQARQLLAPQGQILCDLLDVRQTANPTTCLPGSQPSANGPAPAGQMQFPDRISGSAW